MMKIRHVLNTEIESEIDEVNVQLGQNISVFLAVKNWNKNFIAVRGIC